MDYDALKAALSDPQCAGLDDAAAAAVLNARTVTTLVPNSLVRFRTLYAILPQPGNPFAGLFAAVQIEQGLRQLAQTLSASEDPVERATGYAYSQVVKWMDMTSDASGIDVGTPTNRAVIDSLVGTVLDADQAAAIKAVGEARTPWPATVGCNRPLDFADIAEARKL